MEESILLFSQFFVQIHLRLIGKKNFGDLVSDGILKTKLKEACYRKVESDEELNRFCAKSLYNLDYFKSAVFVLNSLKATIEGQIFV